MSLSTALFSGVSGLNVNGDAMSVVGNNISNINTFGFKGAVVTFEDFLYQNISGSSGVSQIGRGVTFSTVTTSFSQGSFENTNEPTDMAIGGKGFFMLKDPNSGTYYTRVGQFRFDKDGYLVNPSGMIVQGWILTPDSPEIKGAITDILVSTNSSSPNATEMVNVCVNLDTLEEVVATPATVSSDNAITSGFVFVTGENDQIEFDEGGGDLTASLITQGELTSGEVYTGAQVAQAIEKALEDQGANDYAATYSTTNNTFTITNNDAATAASLHWTDVTNTTASATLGFSTAADGALAAGGGTDTSDNQVEFNVTTLNNTFGITVDGNPVTGNAVNVTISTGAYTTITLEREMEDKINRALSDDGETVTADVRYDTTDGKFYIMSSSKGTSSRIDLDAGSTNFLPTIDITTYDVQTGGNGSTTAGFTSSYQSITDGFMIKNNINDVIEFDVGGGNLTADLITQGGLVEGTIYTGSQIASAVKTALEAADGVANTYTVTYDAASDKFTIQNDTGGASTINIHWIAAATTADTLLGYTENDTIAVNSSATGDSSVAFNILTGVNDTFNIIVDGNPVLSGVPVNVTVAADVYTGNGLATAMQTAINNALSAAGETITAKVTYSDTLSEFTIASNTLGEAGTIKLGDSTDVIFDLIDINDFTENSGMGFQVSDPDNTSNYSTSLISYDSLGNQHNITVYFRKSHEQSTANVWEWFCVVGAGDSASGKAEVQASGTLTFSNTGVLTSESDVFYPLASGGLDFGGGAEPGQKIDFNFGLNASSSSGMAAATQYRSASSTIFQSQDGYGSGFLQTVTVDSDGVITGNYSNGQVLYLARVALANFNNQWGLVHEGRNLYSESRLSGQPITGAPGSTGMGNLSPNSLEQSNVDLASEFVKMILFQRGFQANSRIITTTDEMLAELINLKR
ncbi:MAG: flagellar hook-basal body complex protein [Thermodesulfobacteriota bacterium]|nr:flagellar hook-basal body complex protein [Thermodesulfobacteriota bacterium]